MALHVPRDSMIVASPGFVFASYPRLKAEEVSNLEMPIATDKINPKEKLTFSIQKTKRRAA